MPTLTLLRLLAILVVAATVATVHETRTWYIIIANVGFGHYLVGALYSRRQTVLVVSRHSNWIPFLALSLVGAGLYVIGCPLLVYFSLHHAFNETYMLDRTVPPDTGLRLRRWRVSGLVLHLVLYFFLVRHSFGISYASWPAMFLGLALGLAAAYATFFSWLYRLRTFLTTSQIVDNCSLEIVAIGLVAVSLFVQIGFLQIVLYHFAFWALFPMVGARRQGVMSLARYVALTVGIVAAFVAIEAPSLGRGTGTLRVVWDQFLFWSYVHITLSFAVSAANPGWVRRLFGSRSTAVAAPIAIPAEA